MGESNTCARIYVQLSCGTQRQKLVFNRSRRDKDLDGAQQIQSIKNITFFVKLEIMCFELYNSIWFQQRAGTDIIGFCRTQYPPEVRRMVLLLSPCEAPPGLLGWEQKPRTETTWIRVHTCIVQIDQLLGPFLSILDELMLSNHILYYLVVFFPSVKLWFISFFQLAMLTQ